MTKIVSIVNQKGGVGKTTTALNIATGLSAIDKKCLLIDLDSQGNASTGMNISPEERNVTSYDIMTSSCLIEDAIMDTDIRNLHMITAKVNLSSVDRELSSLNNHEYILKHYLEPILDEYDYILIDCPPALNLLTLNALVASNSVIIPVQCEFFALEGLSHLLSTISKIQDKFNSSLEIMGILLTMYDVRNNLSKHVELDVRKNLGNLVYRTVIPRNITIAESSSFGQPVIIYDVQSAGAKAYIRLVKEVLLKEIERG